MLWCLAAFLRLTQNNVKNDLHCFPNRAIINPQPKNKVRKYLRSTRYLRTFLFFTKEEML